MGVNALTSPATDPVSHQPELKFSAICAEPARLVWQAAGWTQGDAAALRVRLAPWLRRFEYAVVLPVGAGGVRIRLAAETVPAPALLAELADALGLTRAEVAFDDPARGRMRRVAAGQGVVRAFLLTGDLRAQDALLSWSAGGDAPASVSGLLTGRIAGAARSRTVCVCVGVSEAAILAGIERGCDLQALNIPTGLRHRAAVRACLEIQSLIARIPAAAVAA